VIGFVDHGTPGDGFLVEAGESHDRGSAAFAAEGGKRLGMLSFPEEGGGEDLGGDYGPLPAPSVKTDFNHLILRQSDFKILYYPVIPFFINPFFLREKFAWQGFFSYNEGEFVSGE
jgi:hypothetical protein